jgi:methylmalonyl-CoA/ethylmalonyl-CoA epimerase
LIKKLDHIAIAVSNLEEEIKRYRDVLGMDFHGRETVTEQKVNVAFFRTGDIFIELMEPTGPDSPISAFIEKRGPGIHHLALEVDNLPAQIHDLQAQQVRMLDVEPRHGAHNSLIAFAHPKSFNGVLIEFKQKGE